MKCGAVVDWQRGRLVKIQSLSATFTHLHPAALVVTMSVVMGLLLAEVEVVDRDIGGEGDDGDTEPGEQAAEHGAIGEDRVLAPGLALCPGIPKERQVSRHILY